MKAAIFDLFGTLVPSISVGAQKEMLEDVATTLSVSPERIRALWIETADDRTTGRFASLQDAFRYIIAAVGGDPDRLSDVVKIREDYIRECMRPRPDSIRVLSELKSAGLGTALVSNCSSEVPDLWAECPLSEYIDAAVFSATVGTKKPDLRIFRTALEALAASPTRSVYIADGDSGELAAAASLGMTVIHLLDPAERSQAFLRDTETWEGTTVSSIADAAATITELLAAR